MRLTDLFTSDPIIFDERQPNTSLFPIGQPPPAFLIIFTKNAWPWISETESEKNKIWSEHWNMRSQNSREATRKQENKINKNIINLSTVPWHHEP